LIINKFIYRSNFIFLSWLSILQPTVNYNGTDYGELRKRFIPQRMILFAVGKLNRRSREWGEGHLARCWGKGNLGAHNIQVAWWNRMNPRSETLSTIDGLNQVDYVFMQQSYIGGWDESSTTSDTSVEWSSDSDTRRHGVLYNGGGRAGNVSTFCAIFRRLLSRML